MQWFYDFVSWLRAGICRQPEGRSRTLTVRHSHIANVSGGRYFRRRSRRRSVNEFFVLAFGSLNRCGRPLVHIPTTETSLCILSAACPAFTSIRVTRSSLRVRRRVGAASFAWGIFPVQQRSFAAPLDRLDRPAMDLDFRRIFIGFSIVSCHAGDN